MGMQDMVNEVVDSETAMLKRRIQNLENALRDPQELLLDITRADMYEISELMQVAEERAGENDGTRPEILPIIIDRWQKYTGKEAKLLTACENNGQTLQ